MVSTWQTPQHGSPGYVPVSTNQFLWDGQMLAAEVSPGGSLIRSYMRGTDVSGTSQGAGGVGGLLEVGYHGTVTTNCFVAYDGNGNVAALVNAADGTVAANFEYDPFGQTIRRTGPMASANPMRYSTQYADDNTKEIKYLYRVYSASTGKWVSRDPIGEEGHMGLYGLLGNQPNNLIDVLGLQSWMGPGYGSLPTPFLDSPATDDQLQTYTASSSSVDQAITGLLAKLPHVEGGFSPIDTTLLWIPYPAGHWEVGLVVEGALETCKNSDGSSGWMGEVSVSLTGTATVGPGAGGNNGLRNAGNGRLRNSKGQYAKNEEVGKNSPEGGFTRSAKCEKCENSLSGSVTIEIGARAGVLLTGRVYANDTFQFDEPMKIDYGTSLTFSTYVGAELYLSVTGTGSGTRVLPQ